MGLKLVRGESHVKHMREVVELAHAEVRNTDGIFRVSIRVGRGRFRPWPAVKRCKFILRLLPGERDIRSTFTYGGLRRFK